MKRIHAILVLAVLGLLLGGCGQDSDQTSPQVPSAFSSLRIADKAFLDEHRDLLDQLDYEVFTGTLQSGMGGWLSGTMLTWDKGCTFGVMVPPGAVPDDLGSVQFTMRIPTKQSYQAYEELNLPLIIRLEPSGVNFLQPVTVVATYMPWSGMDAQDVFEYWCLNPSYQPFGTPFNIYQDKNRVRIMIQVPHFSDWEIGPPE